MEEEWRPVVGYESLFMVSNLGRVRSFSKIGTRSIVRNGIKYWTCTRCWVGRIKKLTITDGYHRASLMGVRKSVHILVLEAFVGPRPEGLYGLHEDDDRSNNKLSNLRWGTQKENMADAARNGKTRIGEQKPDSKLTEGMARYAIRMRGILSQMKIGRQLGVSAGAIQRIHDGDTWKHISRDLADLEKEPLWSPP